MKNERSIPRETETRLIIRRAACEDQGMDLRRKGGKLGEIHVFDKVLCNNVSII